MTLRLVPSYGDKKAETRQAAPQLKIEQWRSMAVRLRPDGLSDQSKASNALQSLKEEDAG